MPKVYLENISEGRKMGRSSRKELKIDELSEIANDWDRPMDIRVNAIDGLVRHRATSELSTIVNNPDRPDNLREEALYGLDELNAVDEISKIANNGERPDWLRDLAVQLMR